MSRFSSYSQYINESSSPSKEQMRLLNHYFAWEGTASLDGQGRVCVEDGIVTLRSAYYNVNLPRVPLDFGTVGKFSVESGHYLASLEGSPVRVSQGDFSCTSCESLKSLKGSPHFISGDMVANRCNSLVDLTCTTEVVKGSLYINSCDKLESLRGIPQTVGEDIHMAWCPNLESLEGGPLHFSGEVFAAFKEEKNTAIPRAQMNLYFHHQDKLREWWSTGLSWEEWSHRERGFLARKKFGF